MIWYLKITSFVIFILLYVVTKAITFFIRLKSDKRFYDPLDYENFDKTEFWVVDEEAKGELDYDELEKMLDEEPSNITMSHLL